MIQFPLREDPNADWEARRYAKPIPSRHYVLKALEVLGEPVSDVELAQAFGIQKHADQLESFRHRLRAMQRDGQLILNRQGHYGLVAKMDLLQGTVLGHRDGYGFIRPDDGSEDLYLSYRQMRSVFDGDRVLVRSKGGDKRNRRNAAIVEVLERPTKGLVGQYYRESGVGCVIPDNRRITHEVLISQDNAAGAMPGQFVQIEVTVPPSYKHPPHGRVVEILGDCHTTGIATEMALRTFDIPHEFSDQVLAEANSIDEQYPFEEQSFRADVRSLPLVTIDGEDARDFDDAVYCERVAKGGFRLLVAIADVSYYVRKGTDLDEQARLRGTSVYFPNRVVHMLPEPLSQGVCSLKPGVDRFCMLCEMRISASGKMTKFQFKEGMMRSFARLTYDQVQEFFDSRECKALGLGSEKQAPQIVQNLETLDALFHILQQARKERGAIDFETSESQALFNQAGRIETIVARSRNRAHCIIEECMLLTNVAAAKTLHALELPALYRVHEKPDKTKLEALNQFLAFLGIQLPVHKQVHARDYQKILTQVRHRPDFHLIQTVLLRSMMQACYCPDALGHFGLAFGHYAHFTSPIRRYPDLVVHRAIRYLIRSRLEAKQVERFAGAKRLTKADWLETPPRALLELGQHCSNTERRADEASRDAMGWLKCVYMEEKVGQFYEGFISSVMPFGLFVELHDIFVEGLVHVSTLNRDYYTHDEVHHQLVGERTGQAHCLGDKVSIRVARVDVQERKIDFELIENFGLALRAKKGGGSKKRKPVSVKKKNTPKPSNNRNSPKNPRGKKKK